MFRTDEYEQARQDAYTADVEASVLRFDRMVQIFARLEGTRFAPKGFPVWMDDDRQPVPLDSTDLLLEALGGGSGIFNPINNGVEFAALYRNTSGPEDPARGRVGRLDFANTVEAFRRGLVQFLNVRLEVEGDEDSGISAEYPLELGPDDNAVAEPVEEKSYETSSAKVYVAQTVRARSLGAAAATAAGTSIPPYLPFTVHTRTSGLDIEQSPAYFLTWVSFGGPSTPRDGYILPGLYRFRGRDGQGNYRYDSTKFKVPPLSYASTIL